MAAPSYKKVKVLHTCMYMGMETPITCTGTSNVDYEQVKRVH